MADTDELAMLRDELYQELLAHLLPYWMEHTVDARHGGFVGQIRQNGEVVPEAAKGSVLNARILWTFAAAYRLLRDEAYRRIADRAYAYFVTRFWDDVHEGIFWSLDHAGRPLDMRKQIYAQSFALYGLSEYQRATGKDQALRRAIHLFRLIEAHGYDACYGGYFEAFNRTWEPLDDVRLSEKDLNTPKSMNTQLHILEAYTNLYRAWPDALLHERLTALIDVFLTHILDDQTYHLHPFFDADWTPLSEVISFGHDIEASWLLLEAAEVLGDPARHTQVRKAAVAIARVTHEDGQDQDGGLFYEVLPGGQIDADKHWWPQAEAVVGFLKAYLETDERVFLDAAVAAWAFIKRHVIDPDGGEWFGRLNKEGVPYAGEDKVGLWKCPYHNARACLEVIAANGHLDVLST